ALLGDMNELGEQSEELHRETGRAVAESGIDILLAVGTKAAWMAEEASRLGVRTIRMSDGMEAVEWLAEELREGDALLAKASRTVELERALEALKARRFPSLLADPNAAGVH